MPDRTVGDDGPRAVSVHSFDTDLRSLDEHDLGALLAALDRHGVIAVEGQHLDRTEQLELTDRLGGVFVHPIDRFSAEAPEPVARHGTRYERPNGATNWHFDFSSLRRPPGHGVLQAVQPATEGGDTLFADLRMAYRTLPEPMARRACALAADHSVTDGAEQRRTLPPGIEPFVDRLCGAHHPAVARHPRTGEPVLYVCERLGGGDSGMLRRLIAHAGDAGHVRRHRWKAGDLVIYDQRAVSHTIDPTPWEGVRIMQRTLVVGPDVEPYRRSPLERGRGQDRAEGEARAHP